jgi:hypothetical protein
MNNEKEMKRYKVIDDRNRYRDDPNCEIRHDTEKVFSVNQQTTDDQGNKTIRVLILNPSKFQEERIVDEHEATLLILKGINVVEIASA